ncbi:fatty acyl-CoA reductase wat-like [Melitaea cinxia]|uniref:fatty acyl-CoA reductase wat-like n=1 Tax=Melitaea cinxia TaxID=113334 RepID=UPI001E273790|nr:fatty acyl-CoA reductase wat-like [Melitaea cinxia]
MRDIDEINAEALNENAAIKQAILSGDSNVQKFYDNAVVFITGGSGFIGKQLIEKLLRSCNIMKIYILLRVKKNKTVEERLKALLDDPVYDDLHKEQPNFVYKIVPIEGDSESLKLGIDDENWKTLAEEVNVIVHAAATVNFKETVKTATLINVRGAREVLKLAKICKNLRSLVHLSTAYSHATRSRVGKMVEDDFYGSPISPDILIELAETMDKELLAAMIAPLLKEWPNTYTLTKAVAEELIRVQGRGLPVCIIRPAIVVGSYREPCPGWVDVKNVYGPSGLVLGVTLGILHTFLVKNSVNVDFVPVDIVNNIIIVAAYETQNKYASGKRQINIYAATKSRTPVPFGENYFIF